MIVIATLAYLRTSFLTIYVCHSYYTDVPKYGAPNAYKFSPGLKQKLPKGVCRLDLGKYRLPDLTYYRDDYYPIVIAIESLFPESYKGRAKKSM